MTEPDVDHIVAVHDLRRPIVRAVSSVLDRNNCDVRVSVVAHNLPLAEVRSALGPFASHPRLRVLECVDGVRSPSGPFNRGLEAATARFISIMGSDDELSRGAIDSWLALAERSKSDIVIARVSVVGRGAFLTPPVRVGRTRRLDGVRDRLAYRSAPLGLISRERFGALRFPPGLSSGEDVEYVFALWYSGAAIAFDAKGPAYLVHEDAGERVSTAVRPLKDIASFLPRLWRSSAFVALDDRQREAAVIKILRANLLMWLAYRGDDAWSDEDVAVMAGLIDECREAAPRALRVLSRTDRAIVDAFGESPPNSARARALAAGRTRLKPSNLLPRRVSAVLAREGPLRFGLASRLVAWRGR